jgi:hypothetical protein
MTTFYLSLINTQKYYIMFLLLSALQNMRVQIWALQEHKLVVLIRFVLIVFYKTFKNESQFVDLSTEICRQN